MKKNHAAALAIACALGFGVDFADSDALLCAEEPIPGEFALNQDEDEPAEPLVLSVDKDAPAAPESAPPAKAADAPEPVDQPVAEPTLDFDLAEGATLDLTVPEGALNEQEMQALSQQPLFRECANIISETAPLPDDVDLSEINVPGAELINTTITAQPSARESLGPAAIDPKLEEILGETLAVANIDVDAYNLDPAQQRAIAALDEEIGRIWPLWIEAEINRNVSGRRERDERSSDLSRFSSAPSKIVDAPGDDLALALDEPFWFQVVDLLTEEVFYTKAGDFEQLDSSGYIVLLRDEKRYALMVEEGTVRPTGNARRIKVLVDGTIQGVAADGKLVTDVNLGKIPIFVFQNATRLESADGVFFTPTPYSGVPQRVKLNLASKTGVNQHKLALSNGAPEALLARLRVLCKSKARLIELVSHSAVKPGDVPTDAIASVAQKAAANVAAEARVDADDAVPETIDMEDVPELVLPAEL